MRKAIIILCIVIILSPFELMGTIVEASAPYKTFTFDGAGRFVETQTAYLPVGTINRIGDLSLNDASDLVIVDDLMYIADTENSRILVADLDGGLIQIIGEEILTIPRGIFVTEEQRIYVADEGNQMIHVFSQEGELIVEYGRPDHPLFGDHTPFLPQKLVVDPRGNIYVISQGNTYGIIQLSQANHGEFLGYFGVNQARTNLMGMFRELIFTEEQREQLFPTVPATTTNIAIDDRGIIHTVTRGDDGEMLKKLNMAGNDLLGPTQSIENPTDVLVGPYRNIIVATASGYLIEYTSEGDVLFVFGGQDNGDQRAGLFNTVTGIALDSQHRLYVLDSRKNEIQIFERTEFATLVHEALVYYQEGLYYESKAPWLQVIEMNSLFDFAQVGLGEALFKAEQYEAALATFRGGLDPRGYSDAFWEVRNAWLRSNLGSIFYLTLGGYTVQKVIKYLDRRNQILNVVRQGVTKLKKIKLVRELNFIWFFIKHPIDGYYGIKNEHKVSILSTTIWLIIMIGVYIVNRYRSGFLFRQVYDGYYTVGADILFLVAGFVLLVSSHYLVATITEGEGKLSHVYSGVVYSFMPHVLLIPFATLMSNFLTINEIFLLTFTYTVAYGWVLVLLVIMIKEIHNFSMREVFKNIFITIFTALIFMLIIFIVYVLFLQVYSFVSAILGEVVHRLGNSI